MNQIIVLLTLSAIMSDFVCYDLNDVNNKYKDYFEVRNSRDFTGKVVLVTGSNSGIGEAIRKGTEIRKVSQEVLRLLPKGLKVCIIAIVIQIQAFQLYLIAIGSGGRCDQN